MHALLNPKAYFHFFTSFLRYRHFMSFYKALSLNQPFSLCMIFGMHFENDSALMNSVAAAYVHLATPSVTITCWYKYTAKLEIHTR